MKQARLAPGAGRLMLLLCVIASLACQEEKDEPTKPLLDPNYLAQSSPANVLANLRQAYLDRNATAYAKLFAPEFRFNFNQYDVGNPSNPCPPWWDRSAELRSANTLFASPQVTRVELSFVQDAAVPATGEMEGTSMVAMHEIHLRVDTGMEDGAPLILLLDSGLADFYFQKYPGEAAEDGAPLWRIVRWDDLGFRILGSKRGQPTRWGAIKYLFRSG